MTKRRARLAGGVTCLLLAAALPGCTEAGVPATDDYLIHGPPDEPQAVMPPECRGELRQDCDAIRFDAEDVFVDRMLTAEKTGRPTLEVLPGPRLRYEVRLRFRDVVRGEVLSEYRYAFARWREVADSRRLLVYRKTVGDHDYEATVRFEEVGTPGRAGFGYIVEASLETRSALS